LLDASALVKLYVNEDRSNILRDYLQRRPTYYTTPFCFYETLNVLKAKRLKEKITPQEYHDATFALTRWFTDNSGRIRDIDFTNRDVFRDVQTIAQRYNTDLSDAFQILSV